MEGGENSFDLNQVQAGSEVQLAVAAVPETVDNSNKIGVIAGSVGGVLVVALAAIFIFIYKRKKKTVRLKSSTDLESVKDINRYLPSYGTVASDDTNNL